MRKVIPPAEMEILRYVLENGPITVRMVADHFSSTKGLARTTVLTMMERLRQKGHLKRAEGPAGYLYETDALRSELQQSLIAEFVDRSLGGLVSPFVAYLVEKVDLSESETQEIQRLLSRLDAKDPPVSPDSEPVHHKGDEQ